MRFMSTIFEVEGKRGRIGRKWRGCEREGSRGQRGLWKFFKVASISTAAQVRN